MRCISPAWRTSTYSSRLLAVMARNFTRSSSGLVASSASSSTRRLNCIQEWSRPLNSFCFRSVFVQVVGRDGQELHPLQQRVGRVLGLLKHTPVELHPGVVPAIKQLLFPICIRPGCWP